MPVCDRLCRASSQHTDKKHTSGLPLGASRFLGLQQHIIAVEFLPLTVLACEASCTALLLLLTLRHWLARWRAALTRGCVAGVFMLFACI